MVIIILIILSRRRFLVALTSIRSIKKLILFALRFSTVKFKLQFYGYYLLKRLLTVHSRRFFYNTALDAILDLNKRNSRFLAMYPMHWYLRRFWITPYSSYRRVNSSISTQPKCHKVKAILWYSFVRINKNRNKVTDLA